MAFEIDQVRKMAERVAQSHHLELVDIEFGGGGKSRALRVYLEKDAAERQRMKDRLAAGEELDVPRGVPVELLSGVTHEDCAAFANDFGTLLDVENAIPGAEYTLEVSSPGLERKVSRPEEFVRFSGSVIKIKTFSPVNNSRSWTGRLLGIADEAVRIDVSAVKQGKSNRKAKRLDHEPADSVLEIPLREIEKANLVASF